jgi:hypothetical protein
MFIVNKFKRSDKCVMCGKTIPKGSKVPAISYKDTHGHIWTRSFYRVPCGIKVIGKVRTELGNVEIAIYGGDGA